MVRASDVKFMYIMDNFSISLEGKEHEQRIYHFGSSSMIGDDKRSASSESWVRSLTDTSLNYMTKGGTLMYVMGMIISTAVGILVAVFFISSQGLSWLTGIFGFIVACTGLVVGIRYDRYAYLAKKDDLTDCYNRRFITAHTGKLIRQADKSGKPLCIALIDLDDFKKVNDNFGHRQGDYLLKIFSKELMAVCRKEDCVARLGDDEFIVVSRNTNLDQMEQFIARFHKHIARRYVDVKYSVGTAEYPRDGDSYDALINYAERKMYEMKWSNAQEETEERYVNFIRNNQQILINQWFEEVREYNFKIAKVLTAKHLQHLFDYLLDLKVPLYQHELMLALQDHCSQMSEQGITSEEFRISASILRNLLIDHHDAMFMPFPIHVVKEVIGRLDELETAVNNEFARLELIKRENDITELHEDRLSLIGKMAASMAHEIRNPLTSIKGFLKLIRANIPSDSNPNIEKYINIIESEFENIHMQITGLLSFSKKQIIEESFSYLSANGLLYSMISLLSPRLINENVELKLDEQEEFTIYGQKVALQQVISNVLNNGIDALSMNQDRDKIMRIQIYSDEFASYIAISNNGPEIPENVKDSIFRPFTTTKEDGTGLGLAICKQIMEKNNGDISFKSSPEETTFTLIFYKEADKEDVQEHQAAQ